MTTYDIIIIGSGPGGYTTAAEAARLGLRSMIVERDELGGTCLNRGCIPTKALCRTAEAALLCRRGAQLGIETSNVTIDYARAAARKDDVVASLREGVAMALNGVDIVRGNARFAGDHVVAVGDEEYDAPRIIIATGSRPATLPVEGAEDAADSDTMLSLTALPADIIIIGGGVIGMEFASIYSALGVKVTVLEYCREILPGFDTEIAKRLRMALKRRGVTIVTSAQVTAIRDGGTVVEYEEKGRAKSLSAEKVMMAVGRRPVVPEGLEAAGVVTERGRIVTDESMSTSVEGIYAIGDVNGRCMLAHAATVQGRVALGLQKLPACIPAAVFTVPECGSVGLTAEQCAAQGIDALEGKAIYRANGKALAMDEPDGLAKIVVERATGRLLGAHICGAHAADLVQELTVAISQTMTARQLLDTVHIHPTLAELIPAALSNIAL